MSDFDDIVAGLDLNIDTREPVDYTTWPVFQLMQRWTQVKKTLEDRGTLRHPVTEEDIDLQGEYMALMSEMKRRGMR